MPTALRIWTDERGLIWADLGDGWPGFNLALADAVSALSPRGTDPALSTYWIDTALERMTPEHAKDDEHKVAGGNETELAVAGETVHARSLYDLFDPEQMPLDAFATMLGSYREAVLSAISRGERLRRPEGQYTSQRNPLR
jgi:hypothetical protein